MFMEMAKNTILFVVHPKFLGLVFIGNAMKYKNNSVCQLKKKSFGELQELFL
jgi:hypothetical protein